VEYEAVSLIAYEGQKAYARAREQARYCRGRGSEDGFRFWSAVANEVALRTKGRTPEKR
jgi:aspartate aminotransferase-like enzyme